MSMHFHLFCHFTGFALLIISVNYCNCQRQVRAVLNGKTPLPECSPHSHHTAPTFINRTTNNDQKNRSRSLAIPTSQLESFSLPIIFQLKVIQKLKCDQRRTEIRKVPLPQGQGILSRNKNVQRDISARINTYRPPSYFTTSGYFYDSITNTFYQPDGDYCISSDHCTTSSLSSHTWCAPKCCDIDEAFLKDQSRCSKISESAHVAWSLPIYDSPERAHHRIHGVSKHLRFQKSNLPNNCSVIIESKAFPKDNIKLALPAGGESGVIRPLYLHADSRKWKLVENLQNFCVERFHPQGTDSTMRMHHKTKHQFVMITCAGKPQLEKEPGSFITWAYIVVGVVGAFCFLATIVVYLLIWKKLNLHGLTILIFNVAAFGNYVIVGIWLRSLRLFYKNNLLDFHSTRWLCYGTAVLCHYIYFASHLSLLVLNFDLWLSLKSTYVVRGESKQWKCFFVYSLAIWGFAFALITAFVIIDRVFKDPTTEVPVPGYGGLTCYVSPYFFGQYVLIPMFIIFLINVVLILLTLQVFINMRRQRRILLTRAMSKDNAYSAKIFARLFLVMGIGWSTLTLVDFLLWAYQGVLIGTTVSVLVYIIKFIVYLTPIYLFILFCLNDRVINQLRDKHLGFADKLDWLRKLLRMEKKKRNESIDSCTPINGL